jgi:hypothetical protein
VVERSGAADRDGQRDNANALKPCTWRFNRRHAGTIVVKLRIVPPMLSTMTTMSQSGRLK